MTIQELEEKVRDEIIECELDTDIPDWFIVDQSGFYKHKNVTISLMDEKYSDAKSTVTKETYEEAYSESWIAIKAVLHQLKQ